MVQHLSVNSYLVALFQLNSSVELFSLMQVSTFHCHLIAHIPDYVLRPVLTSVCKLVFDAFVTGVVNNS